MISLSRIALLFFIIAGASVINAQQAIIDKDEVYGSDPVLYNGRFYTFNPPLNTGGNQYFSDPQFEAGSVTLRGVTFRNLLLNYDIYNQQLIIKYKIRSGAVNQIIVSDAWLEAFSFKGLDFKVFNTRDNIKRIYQSLGDGPCHILYYWGKTLKLENTYGATNHTFSAAGKEKNLFIENRILQYRNNKSFYSLFVPEKKIAVKEYLRSHKINVKKANDLAMTQVINYCNTLYSK
jgi:hypothetical protein